VNGPKEMEKRGEKIWVEREGARVGLKEGGEKEIDRESLTGVFRLLNFGFKTCTTSNKNKCKGISA
jgi:cytochrome oxidase Cu insertion factor (SCO1/SenC/PrrC family)